MSERKRRPIVWVTHEKKGFSYAEALQFGDVEFLVPSGQEFMPMPTSGDTNQAIEDGVWKRLEEEYMPGYDYVLLSGSPIVIFLVGQACPAPEGESQKVLRWNGRTRSYDTALVG
jgi:hypothetical protein